MAIQSSASWHGEHSSVGGLRTSRVDSEWRGLLAVPFQQTASDEYACLPKESCQRHESSGSDHKGVSPGTILQFTSLLYFAEEDEGDVVIDVMRLGSLHGRVLCCFHTEDGSGKAGERYAATKGAVVFEDGEYQKSISVPIIQDHRWQATLEFKVFLDAPEGCSIGAYLNMCRIKVIDNDAFPSSRYPEVLQGKAAIAERGPLLVFWEYCKLNFAVQGTGWRTVLSLAVDQLRNAYLFYKLWAMAYMLNVLFHGVSEDLAFTIDERFEEFCFIGAGYILPMIVLHAWDLSKVRLNLEGRTCCYLQRSIVRKYLNFDEDSRAAVDITAVQHLVEKHSDAMAHGYMALLKILTLAGKLAVVLFFTLHQNPRAIGMVMYMPAVMLSFVYLRNHSLTAASLHTSALNLEMLLYLKSIAANYRLIANYMLRPMVNDRFAAKASAYQDSETAPMYVRINNNYFTQWLGPLFMGIFIVTHCRLVLTGALGQGTFIATLHVFDHISAVFSEGYEELMAITSLGNVIKGVTVMLNRPTDLARWKAGNRKRRETTKTVRQIALQRAAGTNGTTFPTDLMPIHCQNMGFAYPTRQLFVDVNLSVQQGCIVAILGKHGHGKQTFLRLIAHELFPTEGEVFIPTHLRILLVSQETYIFEDSVRFNLTVGCPDASIERIEAVLQQLEAWKLLEQVRKEVDEYTDSENDTEDTKSCLSCNWAPEPPPKIVDAKWITTLSWTEKAKLHLARAFLANPEVMVLQRPLTHFGAREQSNLLGLLRLHVENRGIDLPADEHTCRPRTVFLSVESREHAKQADVVWTMEQVTSGEDAIFQVVEVPSLRSSLPPSGPVRIAL